MCMLYSVSCFPYFYFSLKWIALAFYTTEPTCFLSDFFFLFRMSQSLLPQSHRLDPLQANYGNYKATSYLLSFLQKLEKQISVPAADLCEYMHISWVLMCYGQALVPEWFSKRMTICVPRAERRVSDLTLLAYSGWTSLSPGSVPQWTPVMKLGCRPSLADVCLCVCARALV